MRPNPLVVAQLIMRSQASAPGRVHDAQPRLSRGRQPVPSLNTGGIDSKALVDDLSEQWLGRCAERGSHYAELARFWMAPNRDFFVAKKLRILDRSPLRSEADTAVRRCRTTASGFPARSSKSCSDGRCGRSGRNPRRRATGRDRANVFHANVPGRVRDRRLMNQMSSESTRCTPAA